jgi:tRNA (cytidine/uridine-2'-O-)-methyltransferase
MAGFLVFHAAESQAGSGMQIALYEPDIPQNTGTIVRLGACLGVPVHIIGPAGFDASERAFRRAGLDYIGHAQLSDHVSFSTFNSWRKTEAHRLVLLTTKAETPHTEFAYSSRDILLCGRESSGVPDFVHAATEGRVRVPIRPQLRSLNVAVALAMVLGEALRQTEGFPNAKDGPPVS